ncbi:hypothetical protein GCM10022200_05940 [Microbacterium awajiense]|uniref:Uncharacterized protein n=1 Tax=Microbacterium awajiense TaxID=415214 RepID=A0ABP7A7L9_9MICO
MSTLTVRGAGHRATRVDGTLVYVVTRLDATLARRAERRGADAHRAGAQDRAAEARRRAEANGALGILPR